MTISFLTLLHNNSERPQLGRTCERGMTMMKLHVISFWSGVDGKMKNKKIVSCAHALTQDTLKFNKGV